jgi:CRP-like cAMP-binding protein
MRVPRHSNVYTLGIVGDVPQALIAESVVCSRDRRGAVVHHPYTSDPHPLVRKLESIVDLTSEERAALHTLPLMQREMDAGQDIVREGDRPSQACLMLEGWTFRYKMAGDDRRQIFSFHIPGDTPDLLSIHLKTMDHSLATLTHCRVGFIQHRALHDLFNRHPRLCGVFWRDTLIDAAIFREWMVGMGRRRAPSRIAHLLCELYVKLEAIGMVEGNSVQLPITQETIADSLGLSPVHVNRALMALRSKGLFTFERRTLTVHKWDALAKVAEFDPAYLHLEPLAA